MGFICQMPGLSSHLHTIGHVRNPWPLLSSAVTSSIITGSGWEQRRRGAFYPSIKGHLGRQFSQDSSALVFFFFFFWHHMKEFVEEGKKFYLIKDTFHISSPLSPVISLFRPALLPLSPSLLLCLFCFLSFIIRSPKVPFAVTVPFWLALDAF